MDSTPFAIDLPEHWTGSLRLAQTSSGSYVGMASLSLGGIPRWALVITPQLTLDAAMERVRLRIGHFVREQELRPSA
ncbi:hypothetical protein NU688_13610 [Variovorax sp. ZS18.2.2]|uniref:hypothetical protein n=1 Tax=Variovorax sp. ZS18.2.2 TaxID=2971255 RepID=UPI0021518365|nr:hypothetical protein [Variovorax sp. ZS18.2.2]MCR6477192.1 hypothetical protein [Variovorax sp. ZS18.2.2]